MESCTFHFIIFVRDFPNQYFYFFQLALWGSYTYCSARIIYWFCLKEKLSFYRKFIGGIWAIQEEAIIFCYASPSYRNFVLFNKDGQCIYSFTVPFFCRLFCCHFVLIILLRWERSMRRILFFLYSFILLINFFLIVIHYPRLLSFAREDYLQLLYKLFSFELKQIEMLQKPASLTLSQRLIHF